MGDRYPMDCPHCGEKDALYFANWNNYADKCLNCGRYFIMYTGAGEVTKEEYDKRIMEES
jgi:uncharacterized protein (DUF983 family)